MFSRPVCTYIIYNVYVWLCIIYIYVNVHMHSPLGQRHPQIPSTSTSYLQWFSLVCNEPVMLKHTAIRHIVADVLPLSGLKIWRHIHIINIYIYLYIYLFIISYIVILSWFNPFFPFLDQRLCGWHANRAEFYDEPTGARNTSRTGSKVDAPCHEHDAGWLMIVRFEDTQTKIYLQGGAP